MHVTIGILAYNEEKTIATTIRSLLAQSVFAGRNENLAPVDWEIVVVPNGCKDATAEVAVRSLSEGIAALPNRSNVKFRVEVVTQAGKSNAWNLLIHRYASADTHIFVMMDADIEFGHPDTIGNCVRRLLQDDHARVVVDLPLKHFTRKAQLSPFERLSAHVSKMNMEGSVGVSGQFYCAKAEFMRQVWMPVGLSVEDGFLSAMATTDCFRTEPDRSRVVRAADASHYFEGLVKPGQILHHEVRIVVGTVLNCYLCWDALLFLTPASGPGAGELVKQLNEREPGWYSAMMMNQVRARGRWIVPSHMLFRRLHFPWKRPYRKLLTTIPVRLAAFLFDVAVFLSANRKLRSGRAVGLW